MSITREEKLRQVELWLAAGKLWVVLFSREEGVELEWLAKDGDSVHDLVHAEPWEHQWEAWRACVDAFSKVDSQRVRVVHLEELKLAYSRPNPMDSVDPAHAARLGKVEPAFNVNWDYKTVLPVDPVRRRAVVAQWAGGPACYGCGSPRGDAPLYCGACKRLFGGS